MLAGTVLGYDEAMSCVDHARWIITSPNMQDVPYFPADRASLRMRVDGRFGDEDFTLVPQVFTAEYAHRILIRRRPGDEAVENVMWWSPTRRDFEPLSRSSYQSLGRFRSDNLTLLDAMSWNLANRAYNIIGSNPGADWAALEALISNMRHGIMRLKHSPYTFKELIMDVAQTQRFYLDSLAMCDYVQDKWANKLQAIGPVKMPPRSEFIGAWTADASVVQKLHHAGIPVYFVRDRSTVLLDTRDWVNRGPWNCRRSAVAVDTGLPERYSGIPNRDLHRAASRLNEYGEPEKLFYDLDDNTNVIPAGHRGKIELSRPATGNKRNRTAKRQPKGFLPTQYCSDYLLITLSGSASLDVTGPPAVRDKWAEITGDYIPESVEGWPKALKSVDRSDRQSTIAPKDYTGYRFPDPGMLVFSVIRRERNLFNWLLIRDANIRRVMHDTLRPDGIPKGFSNETWHMILGVEFTEKDKLGATGREFAPNFTGSTRSSSHAERRQAAITMFGQPPDGHNFMEVEWRNHTITWDTFFKHDALLVQEIIWDVHQYSFQYDLIALDHYHCTDKWNSGSRMREELVCRVIGRESCYLVDNNLTRDCGIASSDGTERLDAYKSLDLLMSSWPTSDRSCDLRDPSAYIQSVAQRFCQSFVRAFGRPPILPKMLPRATGVRGLIAYKRT